MPSWIDGSLYPDKETPAALDTLESRVDYLARLCGAWDFGVLPELPFLGHKSPEILDDPNLAFI